MIRRHVLALCALRGEQLDRFHLPRGKESHHATGHSTWWLKHGQSDACGVYDSIVAVMHLLSHRGLDALAVNVASTAQSGRWSRVADCEVTIQHPQPSDSVTQPSVRRQCRLRFASSMETIRSFLAPAGLRPMATATSPGKEFRGGGRIAKLSPTCNASMPKPN